MRVLQHLLICFIASAALSSTVFAAEIEEPADQPDSAAAEQPASASDDITEPDPPFISTLKFRFGVGAGPVAIFSEKNSYGAAGILEPKISFGTLNHQLRAGMRIQGAGLYGGGLIVDRDQTYIDFNMEVFALGGYLLKAEYTAFSERFGPMVGLGTGLYYIGGTSHKAYKDDSGTQAGAGAFAGKAFGVMPQIGIDLGGFRIAAGTHLIFTRLSPTPIYELEFSYHY